MTKVIRFVITIMLSLIMLNVLVFLGLGIYKTFHAFMLIYEGRMEERPGAHLAEGFDSFLIALFFIIFSVGIARLFLPGKNFLNRYELPWLEIRTFSELKFILWELLLTTLIVFFVTDLTTSGEFSWQTLILPGSILLLALAYRLLKKH